MNETVEAFIAKMGRAAAGAEISRLKSMLDFESECWTLGFTAVAGVDEAGRGPIAGPLAAAAVVLSEPVPKLNDSKKLGAKERERIFEQLIHGRHRIGVSIVSSEDIDALGIQQANYRAMIQAVMAIMPLPDFVLVDGYRLAGLHIPCMRIIKGDARSLSIAAASVVAKVTRDRHMDELHASYPQYGFSRHKGYATREHVDALDRFGPSPAHRRSFAPLAASDGQMRLL